MEGHLQEQGVWGEGATRGCVSSEDNSIQEEEFSEGGTTQDVCPCPNESPGRERHTDFTVKGY